MIVKNQEKMLIFEYKLKVLQKPYANLKKRSKMNNQLEHYISIEPDFFQELEGEIGIKFLLPVKLSPPQATGYYARPDTVRQRTGRKNCSMRTRRKQRGIKPAMD